MAGIYWWSLEPLTCAVDHLALPASVLHYHARPHGLLKAPFGRRPNKSPLWQHREVQSAPGLCYSASITINCSHSVRCASHACAATAAASCALAGCQDRPCLALQRRQLRRQVHTGRAVRPRARHARHAVRQRAERAARLAAARRRTAPRWPAPRRRPAPRACPRVRAAAGSAPPARAAAAAHVPPRGRVHRGGDAAGLGHDLAGHAHGGRERQAVVRARLPARQQAVGEGQARARAAAWRGRLKVPEAQGGVARRQLRQLAKVRREQRGRAQAEQVLADGPRDGDPICSARRTGTFPSQRLPGACTNKGFSRQARLQRSTHIEGRQRRGGACCGGRASELVDDDQAPLGGVAHDVGGLLPRAAAGGRGPAAAGEHGTAGTLTLP